MIMVFIQPHERREAIEAYEDRLTREQVEQIEDAPDEAIVRLSWGINVPGTTIQIIEEG